MTSHKAQLTARGFTHPYDISTLRLFLMWSNWTPYEFFYLWQPIKDGLYTHLDIFNTFLYGDLDE